MGIAAVSQRSRHRASIEGHLADFIVDGRGGDAGLDQRRDLIKDGGGQMAGLAHPGKAVRSVELDRPVTQQCVAGFYCLIFGHGTDIARSAPNCEIVKRCKIMARRKG